MAFITGVGVDNQRTGKLPFACPAEKPVRIWSKTTAMTYLPGVSVGLMPTYLVFDGKVFYVEYSFDDFNNPNTHAFRLRCLDITNGNELWFVDLSTIDCIENDYSESLMRPVACTTNLLYVYTGSAINSTNCHDVTIKAFNPTTGALVWTSPDFRALAPQPFLQAISWWSSPIVLEPSGDIIISSQIQTVRLSGVDGTVVWNITRSAGVALPPAWSPVQYDANTWLQWYYSTTVGVGPRLRAYQISDGADLGDALDAHPWVVNEDGYGFHHNQSHPVVHPSGILSHGEGGEPGLNKNPAMVTRFSSALGTGTTVWESNLAGGTPTPIAIGPAPNNFIYALAQYTEPHIHPPEPRIPSNNPPYLIKLDPATGATLAIANTQLWTNGAEWINSGVLPCPKCIPMLHARIWTDTAGRVYIASGEGQRPLHIEPHNSAIRGTDGPMVRCYSPDLVELWKLKLHSQQYDQNDNSVSDLGHGFVQFGSGGYMVHWEIGAFSTMHCYKEFGAESPLPPRPPGEIAE